MTHYEYQVAFHTWDQLSGARTWESTFRSDPYDTYNAAFYDANEVGREEVAAGMCDEYRVYIYTVADGEDVEVEKW